MFEWIQGLSAVGTMIATVLLVLVTFRLARVTNHLADAARNQTEFLSRQTKAMEDSARREADRDTPRVRITAQGYSWSHMSPDTDEVEHKHFYGCTITNAGFVDLTISSASLVSLGKDSTVVHSPIRPREWRGHPISNDDLPAKLRHGDSVKVLYHAEDLVALGAYLSEITDTLGNSYQADHWCLVPEPGQFHFVGAPDGWSESTPRSYTMAMQ